MFGGFGHRQTDRQTDWLTNGRTTLVVKSLSRLKKLWLYVFHMFYVFFSQDSTTTNVCSFVRNKSKNPNSIKSIIPPHNTTSHTTSNTPSPHNIIHTTMLLEQLLSVFSLFYWKLPLARKWLKSNLLRVAQLLREAFKTSWEA